VIEIRDNGVGFPLRETERTSLGILGMRERAAELGGTVEFESEPGKGTVVRLTLPYAVVKAEAETARSD
jgi:two-component system sensor histidine kinase UhpB